MPRSIPRKSRTEVLNKIEERFQRQHLLACRLLESIKSHQIKIESLLNDFRKEEPDLVYRFYHQSYKVFIMNRLTERANDLFEDIGSKSFPLNAWYLEITNSALEREFGDETNSKWLEETMPVVQAFWHAKYFLEQMMQAANELEGAPQILPSGWAAILCLYNLR